ncbi:MAG: ABC transporter permease [Alphaproteobacteria bacterium]|nr:ABC transporter permease [Alphaproteobacteria bacterium]
MLPLIAALVALGFAGLGQLWTPYDPHMVQASARFLGTSWQHPLGTDAYGRDVLSRVMVAVLPSYAVAVGATMLGLVVGVIWGGVLQGMRPLLRRHAYRSVDVVFAFPVVLTAIVLAASRPPDAWNVVIALAVFSAAVFARQSYVMIQTLQTAWHTRLASVEAAPRLAIYLRHILPFVLSGLTVHAFLQVSLNLLIEAGLSYLGYGVQPPTPSLGRMLYEAHSFAIIAPWQLFGPGCVILASALLFGGLAETLRRYQELGLLRG